ncbi:MAG: hypothetical protein M0009_12050 [Deltaproteobacteria bacterium]|nr:hypothetical protein [Deltaproteobacteria bacterium]
MTKPMGLLIAGFNYRSVPEDEFNDWYDYEHIPQRQAIPGFLDIVRWLGADDPKVSVVTFELESAAVLSSPPYLAVVGNNMSPWSRRVIGLCENLGRFAAEQLLPGHEAGPQDAEGLLIAATNVLPEAESEFNAWYNEEHIPRLRAVPGVLCARRFRTLSGPRQYVATYHLSHPEVPASAAWQEAIATPRQRKMDTLTSDRMQFVLRRYQRKG